MTIEKDGFETVHATGTDISLTSGTQTPDTSAEAVYLIRKNGAWYRPNSEGYTISSILAGRYTLEEAESITHPNGLTGPRDGMTFVHEDNVPDDDLKAYRTLAADNARLRAELAEAREIERLACGHKAREYAEHYPDGSDGRNTFIILAEQIESNNIGRNVAAIRALKGDSQ